jgi:hypothetical protein
MKFLLRSAKAHTKEREAKNNNKINNTFDIDFDFLVNLYNQQEGLCAYSGIPMTFGKFAEKDWTMSLERKSTLKGYTRDNVHLICFEFNTPDRTVVYKDTSNGSCGWNRDKFLKFCDSIAS